MSAVGHGDLDQSAFRRLLVASANTRDAWGGRHLLDAAAQHQERASVREASLCSGVREGDEPALPSRQRPAVTDESARHRLLPPSRRQRTSDAAGADAALLEGSTMRDAVLAELLG